MGFPYCVFILSGAIAGAVSARFVCTMCPEMCAIGDRFTISLTLIVGTFDRVDGRRLNDIIEILPS